MENTVNPEPAKKGKEADDDHLSMLVDYFEESEDLTRDARGLSERCRDYYDNKQWTLKEATELNKRGQPALAFNKVKRKINFLNGHQEQSKADPKAYPRNYPADEDGAEAATDALRYVQQSEFLEDKFSTLFDSMAVEGYGGIEVLYNVKKKRMELKSWAWDRLFHDPHSSKADFSDDKYRGGVVWMDEDDAKRKYKENADSIDLTINGSDNSSQNETHDDKPRTKWVSHGKRKRVRVVQIYFLKDGDWWWAHYTKGGILDGNMPVIYKDEDGETECPLILQSAYVDRENNRYGEVVELLDVQDEINKRRSKLLYMNSVRQVVAEKGAVDNKEMSRKEIARPDGWIEVNPGKKVELLQNSDQIAGQAQLLAQATQEMEFAGPNASLMGDTNAGSSGRAIIASQQGGLTELGRFLARFRHAKLRVYRQIWNRIRQFWTEEKWVRVTDNEQNMKFVGLNIPETFADEAIAALQNEIDDPDELSQMIEEIKKHPDAKKPTGKMKNNVAEMDMDIIIDEAPDTVTIQQEQFEQIVRLGDSGMVQFDPEDIIMMSNLRNKDKVLERIEKRTTKQATPEQQALIQRDAEAEVAKKEASAAKDGASAEKTEIEAAGLALELGATVGAQ